MPWTTPFRPIGEYYCIGCGEEFELDAEENFVCPHCGSSDVMWVGE